MKRCALMLAVTAVLGMQAMDASAQQVRDEATDLDKVVVTATRVDQALADTPVSATVPTESFIRDARVRSLRDIDAYAPNVHFNQIGQVGGTYITIRGIESNPFIVNRAAVYIDGIPFRQPSDQALGFAEQVEVLRGPQGTLYGANTESGLILVRTRMPTDEVEAEATLSAFRFGTGDGYDGRVSLAGPLLPGVLAGSLVATQGDADSYVRNPVSSIGADGEIRNRFLQGKLRWTPGEFTRVDVVGYAATLRAPGLYEQEFLPMDRDRYDANYAAYNGGRSIGRYELLHDAPKSTEEDEYVLGANLQHMFDLATLDVSLSRRSVEESAFGTDLDMTATPISAGGHAETDRYWNLEARLASSGDGAFGWVAGYNHYRDEREKALSTLVGAGTLADYSSAPPQTTRSRDNALFAQGTWKLGADTRLSAGVRYERAERWKGQEAGSLDLGALGTFVFPAEHLSATYSDVLPRVSLDWRPIEPLLLYVSAAKGWIPGGFNLAAAALSVDRDYSRYGAESLWTFEAGAKATFLDGRMLLSGAVFQTDADNWQDYSMLLDANGQVVSTTLITSDASLRSRGVELELTARPSAAWDITASLGVVDAEYTDYAYGTRNFRGEPVKLVPDWDAAVAVAWRPWQGLYLRGALNGVGRTTLRTEDAVEQPAYWTLDLQVGWEGPRWGVRAYADNVTGKYAFNTSAYPNSLFGYDGTWYAGVIEPRVVGVEVDWRW